MFFVAFGVLLNKAVRRPHDPGVGAEVFFHQAHLGPRVIFFKGQQRLRVSGPEAVNALVFVAHHEQVVVFSGQERRDHVLNAGGVLRLIHAQIAVAVLEKLQRFRASL